MSFKQNDINLNNYEEYFIFYMDNELSASEVAQMEEFMADHPHLAEEFEILKNTKLPVEDISVFNKEELFSAAMKMNVVDESLLLYIDNELPPAEKSIIEEKLISNKDFALQHSFLLKTKLDSSEKIQHPNKKELYRHTEKTVYFKVWMRVAAAIIVVLLSSLFFLMNSNKEVTVDPMVKTPLYPTKTNNLPEEQKIILPEQKEEPVLVKVPQVKKNDVPIIKNIPVQDKTNDVADDVAVQNSNDPSPVKRDIVKFDVARFTVNPGVDPINKTITHEPVTSPIFTSYIPKETPPNTPDINDGDFKPTKKGSTKGFLRKVTRFIERNTGIGTVNADNELLIGAVSLKLK